MYTVFHNYDFNLIQFLTNYCVVVICTFSLNFLLVCRQFIHFARRPLVRLKVCVVQYQTVTVKLRNMTIISKQNTNHYVQFKPGIFHSCYCLAAHREGRIQQTTCTTLTLLLAFCANVLFCYLRKQIYTYDTERRRLCSTTPVNLMWVYRRDAPQTCLYVWDRVA